MIALPIVETPQERLWRSLPHLRKDPAFVETAREEFLPGASHAPPESSRRHFLQLLGASMAMSGLAACRRPVEHVMPFAQRPEEVIPGVPLHYATAMPFRGVVRPLLVKSHDGRPTKIEGNPQHPAARGATGLFAQASILSLYDPDRSRAVRHNGEETTWDDFLELCQRLQSGTRRVAILSEETSSPTVAALRERLGMATWVTYRSEGDDAETLGMQAAFGRPLRPVYDFAQSRVIVSLDADFLGPTARNFAHATHTFAEGRRLASAEEDISRLYVVESAYSVTGAMADHRRRMTSSRVATLAADLAARLGLDAPGDGGSDPLVAAMADDLLAAGPQGLILAGAAQPAEVHALCAAINSRLGSIGASVQLLDTGEEPRSTQADTLASLVQDMRDGRVDVLLMLGVNPVYDAPGSLNFAGALANVGESIHVGMHVDETAREAVWHVPRTHYLEAWGDGRSYDGTLSIIQPLIAPLYGEAHSNIEVLSALSTGKAGSAYDLVRETWRPLLAGSFEEAWRKSLHDGFLPGSGYASVTPVAGSVRPALPATLPAGMEIVFRLDPTLLDGSFANNAWCQELPDPITKIVWDNVAVMSPRTARDLGVTATYSKGRYRVDVVQISVNAHSLELPVWILPGHADGSISVTLGYGRNIDSHRKERKTPLWDTSDDTDVYARGALANGVGQNVAILRDAYAGPIAVGAQVTPTSRAYIIVTTQDHGVLDIEARPLLRMGSLDEFRQDPGFALAPEAPTPGADKKTNFEDYPMLWEERHPERDAAIRDSAYWRNQWGMVIDLNTCTGCGTCIVACQAENNIQVVGKKEVGNGRELHWLRLDRYFVSDGGAALEDNPRIVLQPVPCQHCENAPCESVCPVAATVHSPDGTNQMIYNRCIGTRYCANNCPYKVRRFNFFNWSKTIPETVQMAQNPNVSIRFRGVMEKCSFCVQRVRGAQKRANLEERPLHRDEVATACQQACPADAIVFGDLNDRGSSVSLQRGNARNYTMLAELNVKPRVSYLARVSNPNPALESA